MLHPVRGAHLVARREELQALTEAHLSTLSEAPRGVLVAGEAGIGKTRLLTEFVAGLGPDVVVARGQCASTGSPGAALAPVRMALRELVSRFGTGSVLDSAGPAGHLLVALLPELAGEGAPDGEVTPAQLQDIVVQLLARLSDRAPLVVVVEDVHWADAATLELLTVLLSTWVEGRVTVVVTYRTDDVGPGHPLQPFLAELVRSREIVRVGLDRLGPDEVVEMVRSIDPAGGTAEELDVLVERSGGVPFLVEEVLALGSLDAGPLPETLRGLVLARYRRLDRTTQSVLRVIAAGGVTVEHALVGQVYDGDPETFDEAVRMAIGAQVLATEGTTYTFRHALTQEAVHAELLPSERVRYHTAYAEAVERQPEHRLQAAEVAHHRLAAHDLPGALVATLTAARQARAMGAPASAGRLGEQALELWPAVPDAQELAGCTKADLYLATAMDYNQSGGDRAMTVLDTGLADCPRDDPNRYALLLHEAMITWAAQGRPGGAELCEEALAMLPESSTDEDRVVRARVQTGLGITRHYRGDARARRMLEEAAGEARAVVEHTADPAVRERARSELVRALTYLSSLLADQGDVDGALAGFDQALGLSRNHPEARLRLADHRAALYFYLGRLAEARDVSERAWQYSREVGLERGWGCSVATTAVMARLALGDLDRAEEMADRISRLKPWSSLSIDVVTARIDLHLWRDDPAEAWEVHARHRGLMEDVLTSDIAVDLNAARAVGRLEVARGDLPSAWREALRLWSMDDLQPGPSLALIVLGAEVLAALRRAELAPEQMTDREAEARLRASFEQVAVVDVAVDWQALLEAELSGPEGTGTDATRWAEAVDAARRGRLGVYYLAYAWYRLGAAQVATGDRTGASRSLTEAASVAGRVGITRISRLAKELATRAGLARPGLRAPGVSPLALTEREQQVLELVGAGLTNRQIGARLYISDKTVSVHVSAILRKLGAASRTEAAVRAAELGLNAGAAQAATESAGTLDG